jgi:hypothetical protein
VGVGNPDSIAPRRRDTYNECPTWLADAHADLDRAVLEAYRWPAELDDGSILERLLVLNLDREPA